MIKLIQSFTIINFNKIKNFNKLIIMIKINKYLIKLINKIRHLNLTIKLKMNKIVVRN